MNTISIRLLPEDSYQSMGISGEDVRKEVEEFARLVALKINVQLLNAYAQSNLYPEWLMEAVGAFDRSHFDMAAAFERWDNLQKSKELQERRSAPPKYEMIGDKP